MRALLEKAREVFFSVLPIFVIVVVLHVTVTPLGGPLFGRFTIGALFCVVGLTLFLIGVDKGVTPLGAQVGESIVKSNKIVFLLVVAFIVGFFISVAEPGLFIFSRHVETVTQGHIQGMLLLSVVSLGLAVLLAFALYRIVANVKMRFVLLILYTIVFILALFSTPELLVIAFDASGATTGVLAVPFILALAYGMSHLKKSGRASEEDSFGTIAIVSAGAIIAVLALSIFKRDSGFAPHLDVHSPRTDSVFAPFLDMMPNVFTDTLMVIIPLLVILLVFQRFVMRLRLRYFLRMLKGFVYAFTGLFMFFLGVYGGFMDVGALVGHELAALDHPAYIVLIAFAIGFTVVLAEPAVYVLTHQIEDVTSGYVGRRAVLASLAFGVGIALSLAVLRVFVEPLQIWHYLLPGYILAIGLMFFTPGVFVGMAWDAGGVATGPVTATFVLAFVQGAAEAATDADVILDGFGMIAMVALMPIIALQILGILFKYKSKKEGLDDTKSTTRAS